MLGIKKFLQKTSIFGYLIFCSFVFLINVVTEIINDNPSHTVDNSGYN